MENCPLCEMISKGDIASEGYHCCVLKWGKRRAAVLQEHSEDASAEATIEAMSLLGFDQGQYVLKEFDAVAGHWGVEAVPAGEIATIGTSVTNKEK
jgi:hypothetical protein